MQLKQRKALIYLYILGVFEAVVRELHLNGSLIDDLKESTASKHCKLLVIVFICKVNRYNTIFILNTVVSEKTFTILIGLIEGHM